MAVTDGDIYVPEPDSYPDLPHHIVYRFVDEEIGSARCRGCQERWSRDGERPFEEWYREHSSCSELLPPSASG